MVPAPALSIGHGYDIHRLDFLPPRGAGKPLRLGGIPIVHSRGPIATTDGDAVFHAFTDAMLSAAGFGSMGMLRASGRAPESKDSASHFAHAAALLTHAGWAVSKLDCTIVLERPKIQETVEPIAASVAGVGGLPFDRVSVKAKLAEGLGPVGRGLAIEVHALALLCRID